MDKLKKALSGDDDDEESGIVTQISSSTTLSWSTRVKGFAICFVLGVSLSILGSILLWFKNGLVLFAVFYTFGNVLSLASTCFLMGPMNQLKKMFAKTRIIATILVLVMFVLTLVCAFALKNPALTLVCCILQFLALTWYSLSYIPFARDAAKKCFGACLEWGTNFQQPSAFFGGHLWCQRYLLLICHCVPCISVLKSEVLYFHYVYLWMVLFTNYKVIGGLVFYFWKKRNYFLWMFVESSADFK